MSSTTEFISALRESAATVRTAAQALRGAMQTLRATSSSYTGGRRAVAANLQAASEAEQRRAETPALQSLGRTASAIPASAISAALSGDISRALQGLLRSVIGQLTRGILGASGRLAQGPGATGLGGIGGSLLSSLLGGGLSLLLGKLFGGLGRQAAAPAATGPLPLPSLRNFPQLVLPGYASAPASALFGQRAIPRSPGISVSVEYKRGADDFVVAKVAQRLGELNSAEGIY
jgi:hypothetical protein